MNSPKVTFILPPQVSEFHPKARPGALKQPKQSRIEDSPDLLSDGMATPDDEPLGKAKGKGKRKNGKKGKSKTAAKSDDGRSPSPARPASPKAARSVLLSPSPKRPEGAATKLTRAQRRNRAKQRKEAAVAGQGEVRLPSPHRHGGEGSLR